jgi:lipid-A-disaccharide synthase
VFVGHPLADQVPLKVDKQAARDELGLAQSARWVALLPGSRRSEVARLARPFVKTIHWLRQERGVELQCVVALASNSLRDLFCTLTASVPLDPAPTLVVGRTRAVLAAADLVLTASGTASLEAALMRRPMVVAYRVSWLTYWAWQRMGLAKLEHFSLPNLLAGRGLVPEFVQNQVTPPLLGDALLRIATEAERTQDWEGEFAAIHERLRGQADEQAAGAVLDLLNRRNRLAK